MTVELLLPGRRISAPKPPSRIALNMAFGVGNPAILGDKSRYNSHGTIVGAVPAAGVHGYCLDFDPTIPSYVTIPAAHTQLDFTTENFSLVMRVKFDVLVGSQNLCMRGANGADGWWFYIETGNTVNFRTNQLAASQQTFSSVAIISTLVWYTVGFSRNGPVVDIYINGVRDVLGPGVHIDPAACARTAKIGIYDDLTTRAIDGKIEFLRLFRNIALPTSSHLAWHNALA